MLARFFALPGALLLLTAAAGCAPTQNSSSTPANTDLEGQQAQGFEDELDEPLPSFSAQGAPEQQRHDRIRNSAALTAQEAAAIYRALADDLAQTYALSGDPVSAGYRDWQRFNTAPYKSMTHGRRYVSNYANAIARDYGKHEAAGRLPVGSVVAKDSFVVTEDGTVSAGPLFVMEKMEAGFNYVSGDWRYSMISADGVLLGRTKGAGAERVEFCIACHLAVEDQDHLFFVPQQVRLSP